MISFVLICCLMVALAFAQTATRQQVQTYLESVYPMSDFTSLSDTDIYEFFDSLTYYYENYPRTPTWNKKWPNGRVQSHPYAGTVCDCLHIDLAMCQKRPAQCPFWPLDTYLNMDFVMKHKQGFPSNVWFEGLSYPGEWAFPVSCQNYTLGRRVYAFHHRMWLYPETGSGVWFNTGKTAAAPNKVSWLLNYGAGAGIGQTKTEMMDWMAKSVCTNYQSPQLTHCNYTCPMAAQKTNPDYCCCHGHSGFNLGVQIGDIKRKHTTFSWDDALNEAVKIYDAGEIGQANHYQTYPNGTYFGYLDLLDPKIKSIQSYHQFDTAQFYREPQHGGYHSNPNYAFEINLHSPYNHHYWHWTSWCNDHQSALAVLDPLSDMQGYIKNGYIGNGAQTKSISAWKGRPEFLKLFRTN